MSGPFFFINNLVLSNGLRTFRGAVDRLPLVVPLGLHVDIVVFTVGRMGRGVRGTVLIRRQLTIRVRVI